VWGDKAQQERSIAWAAIPLWQEGGAQPRDATLQLDTLHPTRKNRKRN
jgi:hypothetical protein